MAEVWAITGGSGHVGQVLTARLVEEGHTVRLLDTDSPPRAIAGTEFVRGSVTEPADVRRLMRGADIVVHLAGAGMSGRAMLDRDLCYGVNVGGARTVVQCAQEACEGHSAPMRLLHMSSCERARSEPRQSRAATSDMQPHAETMLHTRR